MKKLALALVVSALASFAADASATWVSVAKVTRVRTYANTGKIEIWFDRNVTSGCTSNDRVLLDASYVTTEALGRAQSLATSAQLSQSDVEVNTFAGCINGNGRLDYLSLK